MDNDVPRHRPLAFDKMESLIKEMQDPETGVPVRSQKLFLSVIPSAFMGYDLVEWLMDRFNLDETSNVEAINLANQLCQYGYFFPVNDLKNLVLKDDSSLYRFQSPYYWPWQTARVAGSGSGSGSGAAPLGPDNVEYAIYLVKRTLRNKQRHALEDYEQEALANLKKNLAAKWDFITMQAEEQVRLAKDRKKGDKIVSDSQERAFWRVARPPPGVPSALEQCPVPVRGRGKNKRRTTQQLQREIETLKASLDRTRVKTSIALEALVGYSETFAPYDPWLAPPQPSNPWISDDTLFWQINSPLVEVPSEKRVQRWALAIEELVADPTGLQEFTSFLRKEYSHENIRFWLAVMDLRRSSTKEIPKKLDEIYEEFLKPGAPCEINIDGATQEKVAEGLRSGSRYALDHAADHVYGLLLKKDCYPRFVRSDHFQRLLAEGKNVHQKKAKFFNFGGQVKKKPGSSGSGGGSGSGAAPGLGRRRGSDRSLSGSAHELAVCAAQPPREPSHSHSQCNLAEIPFRDPLDDGGDEALPWETHPREGGARRRQDSAADSGSSSSDVSACVAAGVGLAAAAGVAGVAGVAGAGVAGAGVERRRLPQQSTLDGGLRGAPPPLRRLSAVEPRHLAPLASPPHSPRAPRPAPPPLAPAPAPAPHAPHPTPTISVSSAPDDDSPDERPLPPEEPSSVFPTPTEPVKPLAAADPAPVCDDTCRTDASADVTAGTEAGPRRPRRPPSREPSTIKEISPASSRDSSGIGDLPVSAAASEKSPPPARSVSIRGASAPPSRASSGDPPGAGAGAQSAGEPAAAPTEPPEPVIAGTVELAQGTGAATLPERAALPALPAARSALERSLSAGAAPLAELEELTGDADDDNADKVPLAPPPATAPAPAAPAAPPDVAKPIAHRDELSSVSQPNNVKRDNKSESGERAPRNDVCPWEDELAKRVEPPYPARCSRSNLLANKEGECYMLDKDELL